MKNNKKILDSRKHIPIEKNELWSIVHVDDVVFDIISPGSILDIISNSLKVA